MGLHKCTYHSDSPCGDYADYAFSRGGRVIEHLCHRHARRVVEYHLGSRLECGRMGELTWCKVSARERVACR